ncbi:MAG: arginase [Solirubrobacteraceae bacterium]|nr:arginase [Solirubrobacteraceae bacterium]
MVGALTAVALLCRTSDRGPEGAEGAAELGELLGARAIGSPGGFRDGRYDEDLRDARGCLLEAGGQVEDALVEGRRPLLLAGDCSVSLTTLPTVIRHHPAARILWLDAHGDFHSPDTTVSGYLGGMCLAGACGVWDPGLGHAPVDPASVVQWGVRELEGGERVLLETRGVHLVQDVSALEGLDVYLHVDLDVLDPGAMPARFPVRDGASPERLRSLLADVAGTCTVLGAEVTSIAPAHATLARQVLDPIL